MCLPHQTPLPATSLQLTLALGDLAPLDSPAGPFTDSAPGLLVIADTVNAFSYSLDLSFQYPLTFQWPMSAPLCLATSTGGLVSHSAHGKDQSTNKFGSWSISRVILRYVLPYFQKFP